MSEKGKTILILGNGFDLAHGLPTRYSDFLEFCKRVKTIWTYETHPNIEEVMEKYQSQWIHNWDTNDIIKKGILDAFFCAREKELNGCRSYENIPNGIELIEIYDCLN